MLAVDLEACGVRRRSCQVPINVHQLAPVSGIGERRIKWQGLDIFRDFNLDDRCVVHFERWRPPSPTTQTGS